MSASDAGVGVDVRALLSEVRNGLLQARAELELVQQQHLAQSLLPSPPMSPSSFPSLLPVQSPRPDALAHLSSMIASAESKLKDGAERVAQAEQERRRREEEVYARAMKYQYAPVNADIGLHKSITQPAPLTSLTSDFSPVTRNTASVTSELGRRYLIQRFGLDASKADTQQPPARPPAGRLRSTRLTRPHVASKSSADRQYPSIPPHLREIGIINLVNRGYLPPHLDFSLVHSQPAPVAVAKRDRDDERDNSSLTDGEDKTVASEESKEQLSVGYRRLKLPTSRISYKQQLRSKPPKSNKSSTASDQSTLEKQMKDELDAKLSQSRQRLADASSGIAITSTITSNESSRAQTANPNPNAVPHTETVTGEFDPLSHRTYDDLLDSYSQHPFFLHRGQILIETPEFESFQRCHAHQWALVEPVLRQLCVLCLSLPVESTLLTVYGSTLVRIIEDKLAHSSSSLAITTEDLLQCLSPMDRLEVDRLIQLERYHRAASRIQATWRMCQQRKQFALDKLRHASARVIQAKWRRYSWIKRTRLSIKTRWSAKVEQWKEIQREWLSSYHSWSNRHRVHIHCPSLSHTSVHVRQHLSHQLYLLEQAQLPRLCELENPLVSIVYLTAMPLSDDVKQYYAKLLSLGGCDNLTGRLNFVAPELTHHFQHNHNITLSLASVTLYSARALKAIKQSLRGRPAVLMPGDASWPDWQLAVELGVPLYSMEIERKVRLDTFTGLRAIVARYNDRVRSEREQQGPASSSAFRPSSQSQHGHSHSRTQSTVNSVVKDNEELSLAVSARDIFDEEELVARLSQFIVHHPTVSQWCVRMDDDRQGCNGAYVDLSSIHGLDAVLTANTSADADVTDAVIDVLSSQLSTCLTLTDSSCYDSIDHFLSILFESGGCIEPCYTRAAVSGSSASGGVVHSVDMLIEPNGQLTMLASHDHSLIAPMTLALSSFPATAPSSALHSLAAAMGKACWREGVIGHVTLECQYLPASLTHAPPVVRTGHTARASALPSAQLTHRASEPSALTLCPTAMHLHWTNSSAHFSLFHFLMKGKYYWRSREFPAYRCMKPGAKERREEQQRVVKEQQKKRFHRHQSSVGSTDSGDGGGGANNSSAIQLRHGGHPHQHSHSVSLTGTSSEDEEDRCYTIVPALTHPSLRLLPLTAFFTMCRLQGLSFDVSGRLGMACLLFDSLAAGTVGLMGVDGTREASAKRVHGMIKMLEHQWQQRTLTASSKADEGASGKAANRVSALVTILSTLQSPHVHRPSSFTSSAATFRLPMLSNR